MYKLRIIELELGTRAVNVLWLSFESDIAAQYAAAMTKPGSICDLYKNGKFLKHLGLSGA